MKKTVSMYLYMQVHVTSYIMYKIGSEVMYVYILVRGCRGYSTCMQIKDCG